MFLTPILDFALLILCWLCINNKSLVKKFFDLTIMGGATIIYNFFFKIIHDP